MGFGGRDEGRAILVYPKLNVFQKHITAGVPNCLIIILSTLQEVYILILKTGIFERSFDTIKPC